MITANDVLAYVGGSLTDLDYAQTCLNEASDLVDTYVGQSIVPDSIMDRAYLETASELWHRRNSPSGILQYGTIEGIPVRLGKDPMGNVYPLLHKWVVAM